MPARITIHSKYRKYISSLFIFAPMTFIMAFIGVTRNYGLHAGFLYKLIVTWLTMFPIAFVSGLIIIPTGNRLTNKINFSDSRTQQRSQPNEILQGIKNKN